MSDNIIIKLGNLKSEFYDAIKEGVDDGNNNKFSIISFPITNDVINAFNNKSYTPETMDGVVELYDYLQIDLKETYKYCEYGIYKDYKEWKAHDCMKTNEFNMVEYAKN